MTGAFIVFVFLAIFVFYLIARTAVVVPQQHAFVVERLGRFAGVARRRLPHPGARSST